MEIYYDTVNAHYCMNLCGKAKHKVDLGADALGNLTRIENELSKLPARLEAAKKILPLWIPSQSRQKNSPKENVQVGRDNVVCIFVLLISGKYNRCRLVNVGGERCA